MDAFARPPLAAEVVRFVGDLVAVVVAESRAQAADAAEAVRVEYDALPAVVDPANLYSETAAGRLSPAVTGALQRVYVPNRLSNTVSVIDPESLKVVDTFKVGRNPQHVVPAELTTDIHLPLKTP